MSQTWSSKEQLYPGVWVYRDVITPQHQLIERITKTVEDSNGLIKWKEALVGYMEKKPEYRDCQDIKLNKMDNPQDPFENELHEVWKLAKALQQPAADDYCSMYSIRMDYWEAMNVISYGPGQHFQEHADHGFSYVATVSLVAYPNDDYEGGELYFPKINLKIKPKAGDLYVFPSTYLFSHVAMPVTSGMKYSIVTMLDYNDNPHSPEYYKMIMDKSNAQNPGIRY